jgi:hypothetical protein
MYDIGRREGGEEEGVGEKRVGKEGERRREQMI